MTNSVLEPDTARSSADDSAAKRYGWITVTVAIIGGLVVAGTLTGAVMSNLRDALRGEQLLTAPVQGVDSLRVEADSVAIDVSFGDVSQAELRVETRGFRENDEWRLVSDAGVLLVERAGSGFGGGGPFGEEELSLTLPRSLEGELDAAISVSSGVANVEGDFADVVLETSSGASNFDGGAANLTATTGSGASSIDADVPGDVVLSASSGALTVELGDSTPKSTEVSLDSGFASISMPDGPYKLEEVLADSGAADIGVLQSDSAKSTLKVTVGSGYLSIE